jgi:hypothetical protein
MIDNFLDLTWYGIVKNYFTRARGYDSPRAEEPGEQIDKSDSVAMGYSELQGREMFWEKNAVEGI